MMTTREKRAELLRLLADANTMQWTAVPNTSNGWEVRAKPPEGMKFGGASEIAGGSHGELPIFIEAWSRFTGPDYQKMVEANFKCAAEAHNALPSLLADAAAAESLESENRGLREALERIIDGVPASEPGGGLFVEHRDENGEYIGSEQVDPIAVISCIVGIARTALSRRSTT